MNYNKKTIRDVDVAGKKILLRCDFNVPQDKETGAITSDKRIVAALPTIRYLLERNAAVIACSHLGKPKGEWKPKLTLAPVAERLSQLLGQEVIFTKDIVGEDAKAKAAALQGGQIMLAVLGGAKVSDKIAVINNLLDKADTVIIGGGMAYTFAKAQGGSIGKSLCENDKLDYALDMIEKAKKNGVQLLLPTDTVAADDFSNDAHRQVVSTMAIPEGWEGMDIGPDTIKTFCGAVRGAGTVVWNGPMGVFEFDNFAAGTRAMAQALADSGAITIVGGGDSAAAVEQMGFADRITHISTGGGASLEFLEGLELPGVACLLDK